MIGHMWTLSRPKIGGHQGDQVAFSSETSVTADGSSVDVVWFNGGNDDVTLDGNDDDDVTLDGSDHWFGQGMFLDKSRTEAIQTSITRRLT